MNEVLFDSRNPYYKTPFGAAGTRQKIFMRVLVSDRIYVHDVTVFLRRNEHETKHVFSYRATSNGYNEFCVEFVAEREGTYYYRFEINTDWGIMYGGKGENGELVIGEWLPEWQLSVYKSIFTTPDTIKGGLVYHIFCDRFCKKGETIFPRYGKLKEWSDEPGETDIGGVYRADDFFGGNFAGIISKLDYLVSLGVTRLYLSPIFSSNSNHRYDTADYGKVDEMLGGDDGFLSLLAEAKKKGIDIMLDGVFNHTGSDSVYFNKLSHYDGVGAYQSKDSPYYNWYTFYEFPDKYNCWWGIGCVPTIARDAYGFQKMIENDVLDKWIRKGVKGWRLDVVDELSDVFLDDIRPVCKNADADCVLIGEVWEDATTKFSYGEKRRYFEGDELDGVMNYVFKDAIIEYLSDKNAEKFASKIMEITENYPSQALDCCLTLLDSHDTFRIINALSGATVPETKEERRTHRLTAEEYALGKRRLLLASCLQYFLQGVPSLYYGDEVGMQGFEDPFNRRPFPWDKMDEELLQHYRMLGKIRRENREKFIGRPQIMAFGTTVVLARDDISLTVDAEKTTFSISY